MTATFLATTSLSFAQAAGAQTVSADPQTTPTDATRGPATATAPQERPGSDIVVTGTRVVRNGYQAPNPTSVIGAEDIAAKAPNNIAEVVNQFPQLAGSVTPIANQAGTSAGNNGVNALNLRNLGVNRTLVLLDGQRVGASTIGGYVDIDQFPQALIKRVDIETGGASADWGSDAVAGVVNFVLDRTFTGVKGEAQGGVTTYGDDRNYKLNLTAGTGFADDRGHILFSAEIAHSDGTNGLGSRDWYNYSKIFLNPTYTATNGQPQYLSRVGAGFQNATPGGIITSGTLKGTYFGPGGTPAQFIYGSPIGGNVMQGGQYQYADWGKSGDLDPQTGRQDVFGYVSYDLTDRVQAYAQLSYGRGTYHTTFGTQYSYGGLTIKSDNAFIPASIAAQVAASGAASFNLGTLFQDLGPITVNTNRSSVRPEIGLRGDFNAMGGKWTWDVYGEAIISHSYIEANSTINSNLSNAIDAVRAPNGSIVCRSTLTNPTNGCVPFNVFGTGVNSQAAVAYVRGTAWLRTRLEQDVVAANLRGDPFSTWAGPVWFASRRGSLSAATFANSMATCILDLDDGHRAAAGHPGAAIVPAVLAAAELLDASGEKALTAIAIGYEVGIRIAAARDLRAIDTLVTGRWCGQGVAAAIGWLRGDDAADIAEAVAIAGAVAPYMFVAEYTQVGNHTKEAIPFGAVNGVLAGTLAKAGFKGPLDLLDHESFNCEMLTRPLDQGWLIETTYFKPYSCCRWIHAPIDAVLQLRNGIDWDAVSTVEVMTFGRTMSLNNQLSPATVQAAQYSTPFCVAAAAIHGAECLQPMKEPLLSDDRVRALASKVRLTVDPRAQTHSEPEGQGGCESDA